MKKITGVRIIVHGKSLGRTEISVSAQSGVPDGSKLLMSGVWGRCLSEVGRVAIPGGCYGSYAMLEIERGGE